MIKIAFTDYIPDSKKMDELVSKGKDLNVEIKILDSQLKEKSEQYYSIYSDIQKLKQPIIAAEAAKDNIKKMEDIILEGIKKSLLNGKREIIDGPSWGYDRKLLKFFEPILNAYDISFRIRDFIGQGESGEYLHFNFPEKMVCSSVLPVDENDEYKKWLKKFTHNINLTVKKTEDTIQKDFSTLENELFTYMKNGDKTAFTKSKACPAAIQRFEKFAKDNDFRVSALDGIIIAENIGISHLTNRS